MRNYLDRVIFETSLTRLFPVSPVIKVTPERKVCCNRQLKILKTTTRTIATLDIGEITICEVQFYCSICKRIYKNQELKSVVSRYCKFGFDVICYVGTALFVRCCRDIEIQNELRQKNITISLREIAYLGKKFIVYLALAHQENRNGIKRHMQSQGGYILHLDGTCEADSPHLFSSIDELTDIVLGNLKIASENSAKIIPFLEQIEKDYGAPIALVHDMGKAILSSVEAVFPETPNYICHFHFLKDIGKDLLEFQYHNLCRYIKNHRIRSRLRDILSDVKEIIHADAKMQACLREYLAGNNLKNPKASKNSMPILMPLVSLYMSVVWVLEANCESDGLGFPFDRPHLDFCMRLKEAYPILKTLQKQIDKNQFQLKLSAISRFLQDTALKNTINIIRKKMIYFDQLREAMRIALPNNHRGLNDNGDVDIKSIEQKVTEFRQSETLAQLAKTDITYRKMLEQIDKYWDKLFADPIKVQTSSDVIIVQPQRTNNMMEQFFRSIKRDYRRKSGTHSLSKQLKFMLTDTPLVKNLDNPEYLKIILNGKANLAERFADIEIKEVRKAMAEEKQLRQKYPEGMSKIFKIPHLPKKLIRKTMKISASA